MNNREKLTSHSVPASAVALRLNPDLQRPLAELHFLPRQRVLTPLQHEAVLRYLGGTLIE